MRRGIARPARPALPAVLALLALLATAAGCGGTDGARPPTTAGSSVPGASSGTAMSAGPCAWPTKADKETLNIAYPDTSATYWAMSYLLAPGEHLELHGRFPRARYASFITYGPAGGARSVLTDRDIEPDAGSVNPFRGGGEAGGRYTVQVRANAPGGSRNTLDPAVPATATGTSVVEPGGTAPPADVDTTAVLGTGSPGQAGATGGTIIYRVYLPEPAGDRTGGGGLPDVRVVHADGSGTDVATCARPGAGTNAGAVVDANGPATDTPAPAQPVFIRPKAGAANLYPNPDNVYVVTILHHTPGRVVVVRGRAPSFPDTAAGVPVTGREQVRYWSLCTDEYRKPYPVSSCVADHDVVLDDAGSYTFVVSTAADRPPNATAANGVTWLDWGATTVDNLLLLRHMLAAPDFAESAVNLAPGSLATTTMGAYAPRGVYCDTAVFAAGGAAACPTA